MPQTLIEKIAQRYAVGLEPEHIVRAGDYLSIRPAHCLTHDNTGAIIPKFKSIGAERVANPRQPVFALDHQIQNRSEDNLKKYARIEAFAQEHGIDFYPAGRGIGHQIMCEEGYAFPGTLAVASDSHSNMYGGLGCLGVAVVRTDAAAIWATGRTWWQVPPIARVVLRGKLRPGVSGKDVIIALCGSLNRDEVLNHALEFTGDGVANLSIEQRLTIANMTTEWGALAGVFPIDQVTLDWLKARAQYVAERGLAGVPSDTDGKGEHPRLNPRRISELEKNIPFAAEDAYYAKEIVLDLNTVQPSVSGPDHVKVFSTVTEIRKQNVSIHKAYLLSCVNGRVEDLAEAAAILRGKKVAPTVKLYLAAASSEVQAESERRGDWQALLDAGAIPLPPGCGACIGLGEGLLDENEIGISATNRNFKGRMGARSAKAYLASPAVVAYAALTGKIEGPQQFAPEPLLISSIIWDKPPTAEAQVQILEGFREIVSGELIFCHQDNLNTDGIYPGKYTYVDDFTPEQQAQVVMENYDPEFGKIVRGGDILVGGFNFGSGSSREQAATALKYRGVQLVLAGSFSDIYKRNALNNGYLVIEAPELVNDFKAKFGKEKLTVRTGIQAKLDFRRSTLETDGKTYSLDPVGAAAQELIVVGGLENWVAKNL
ncbi:MAG: homoaconitase [bacterium]